MEKASEQHHLLELNKNGKVLLDVIKDDPENGTSKEVQRCETPWASIYLAGACSFVQAVQFGIFTSSMWPYLRKISRCQVCDYKMNTVLSDASIYEAKGGVRVKEETALGLGSAFSMLMFSFNKEEAVTASAASHLGAGMIGVSLYFVFIFYDLTKW
ncbi:hypothetical protein TELCIR_17104 [Teladorsagia circumcincta]|uniref:Uncharacterized protein n=1 Tax=Teladorsagia circumcincta TaxID=45464 RepID=A0A2G9TTX8_TELCI|nr:hypothetical protein TELCIR_17104 [Teladorsagia circumcincta]